MWAEQYHDPIDAFLDAFGRAEQAEPGDHRAVTLATADSEGHPSARIVLLHGVDTKGFRFYTNYTSRKASQLSANPHAALCFYWASLNEQVRVNGPVERLDEGDSDAYFAGRPRSRQIAAWASRQSAELPTHDALETRYRIREARFENATVPRPPFWGGFLLSPLRIEFWKHRDSRLHDRLLFLRDGDSWRRERLYP